MSLVAGIDAQAPPRDPRTAAAAQAEAIRTLDAAVAEQRAPEAAYYQLADLLAARGESDRADAVLLSARDRFPASVQAQTAAAGVYNRRGDFERTVEALRAVAALQPGDPEPLHRIGTFFWDRVRADIKYAPATKLPYILQGIDAENQALALRPDYIEAITYKNLLLRMQANMTTNPAEQAQLIAEADALRNRAIDMLRAAEPTANARVLRSVPLLDAAALDAVSRWRFTPTEIEGRRISLLMTVTVNFTLSPQ